MADASSTNTKPGHLKTIPHNYIFYPICSLICYLVCICLYWFSPLEIYDSRRIKRQELRNLDKNWTQADSWALTRICMYNAAAKPEKPVETEFQNSDQNRHFITRNITKYRHVTCPEVFFFKTIRAPLRGMTMGLSRLSRIAEAEPKGRRVGHDWSTEARSRTAHCNKMQQLSICINSMGH